MCLLPSQPKAPPWVYTTAVLDDSAEWYLGVGVHRPWPGGSGGWSIILFTIAVVGSVSGWGTYIDYPVEARTRANGSMSLSHIDVSLSVSLCPPLSLSRKSINITLGEGFFKKDAQDPQPQKPMLSQKADAPFSASTPASSSKSTTFSSQAFCVWLHCSMLDTTGWTLPLLWQACHSPSVSLVRSPSLGHTGPC